MAMRGRSYLGLSITEKCIRIAALRGSSVEHVAELLIESDWSDAANIGKQLRAMLHSKGIKARRAVIGLPATWIVTRRRDVPSVRDEAMLADMLRLQAQRAFSLDPDDLIVDYVLQPSRSSDPSIVLVAAVKERCQQVSAMATAAGLQVQGITASTAALAAAQYPAKTGLTLNVTDDQSEMALSIDGAVYALRSIEPLDRSTLRRILATDEALAGAGARAFAIWDGRNAKGDLAADVMSAMDGAAVVKPGIAGIANPNGLAMQATNNDRYATAVALARSVGDAERRPVDFLHSRLAPKPPRRIDARIRIAIWPVLAAMIGIGALLYMWHDRSATVDALEAQVADLADHRSDAEAYVARVRRADGWFANRSTPLDVLRAITLAFPVDATIWATDVSLDSARAGVVTGQATHSRAVLDVREALQRNAALREVKLIYMRAGNGSDTNVAFAIAFQFDRSAPVAPPMQEENHAQTP